MDITDAELEVMKVLWASPGQSAADVHGKLEPSQNWSRQTVKTLLSRLVEKGALSTTSAGRAFLYTPAIARDAYETRAASRFVDKVFSGRAAPLVAHLADGRGLSEDDIAELEALLERLKS
ncbi:MAG: BlaI/MecI/CopY family transcriptional regulator [Pseudomonadota bacterium]